MSKAPADEEMPVDSSARLSTGQVGGQGLMLRASPPTAPCPECQESGQIGREWCRTCDGIGRIAPPADDALTATAERLLPHAMKTARYVADRLAAPPADDAVERRARELSDGELALELKSIGQKWADFRDNIEDGHSGSPGEWLFERMDELQTEQDRRLSRTSPTGWKLVPVKPTEEMLEAAATAPDDDDWLSAMGKAYRAMLAAAPLPPADDAVEPVLPCELWVGHTRFGAGVKMSVVQAAITRHHLKEQP